MNLDTWDLVPGPCDGSAVLARDYRVRLVNVSGSGCMVETNRPIPTGTAATLHLVLDDVEYEDEVLVLRCQPIAGAGPLYHIGMQFLWPLMPDERSIRRALAQSVGAIERRNTTRVN
jgi:hypothetical protein